MKNYFDENCINYDRLRPDYPDALFNYGLSQCGRAPETALEVGCGTGKATVGFLKRGIRVDALEPGENLAGFAERRFKRFLDKFRIFHTSFEDFESREKYDLLFSATAFHWVCQKTGYKKAYDFLCPGGAVVLFWSVPRISDKNMALKKEIQGVYEKFYPSTREAEMPQGFRYGYVLDNLEKAGFSKVSAKKFFCIREFSAEDYRDLLTTYSDHMALERDRREMLMSGVQKAVQRYGKVTIDYTFEMYTGIKEDKGDSL